MSRKKKKKAPEIKTSPQLLPVYNYDEKLSCFMLSDGSCMDILRVIPRDMDNLSADEVRMEIYDLIRLYKTAGSDIKFISMNFPLNTGKQREVLKYHLGNAGDEVRARWIQRQIEELETVDRNIHTSNFYLIYFGSKETEFIKNKDNLIKYACSGIDRLCEEIPMQQKVQIILKLCNMNGVYDLHYLSESEDSYE